ncbi:hypothetical protein JCM19992_14320 [Thermostilla marina]
MIRHWKSIRRRICGRGADEGPRAALRTTGRFLVWGAWVVVLSNLGWKASAAIAQELPFPSPIPQSQASQQDIRRPQFDQPLGTVPGSETLGKYSQSDGESTASADRRTEGPSATAVTPVVLDGPQGGSTPTLQMPDGSSAGEGSSVASEPQPETDDGGEQAPLLLRPRQGGSAGRFSASSGRSGLGTTISTLGAVAFVLGLFFIFAWLLRKAGTKTTVKLPSDAVEVLGQAPFVGKQRLILVRCGRKLVLVAVGDGTAEPLTEITDPQEVDHLAGLCARMHGNSSTKTFEHLLGQYAQGTVGDL